VRYAGQTHAVKADQRRELAAVLRGRVLVWDGLSAHKSPPIRAAVAARPWLRVYQLPSYAPELNPVEKVWSAMKHSLANHGVRTATGLAAAVKNRLKRMQYRPGLIDGYFTGTGLPPPAPVRP
jgi:transposase